MNRHAIVLLCAMTFAAAAFADEVQFEASLSPYGEWVSVSRFGRVWRPSVQVVGAEFEPYSTGGEWVYTDQGWAFEADYPFSWAVYHYGRWYRDPAFGWVWVRGNDWAPAWVDWREGGGYVGWVPMAPRGIEVVVPAYRPRWAFVESRYLIVRDPWRHRLDARRAELAYRAAPVIEVDGRRGFGHGPPPAPISVAAGVTIRPRSVTPPPPGVVQRVTIQAPPPNSSVATPPVAAAPPAPGRSTSMLGPQKPPPPAPVNTNRAFSTPPPNPSVRQWAPPAAPPVNNANRGFSTPPPTPSSRPAAPAPSAPPVMGGSRYAAPPSAPRMPSSPSFGSGPHGPSMGAPPAPSRAPAPSMRGPGPGPRAGGGPPPPHR